MKQKEHRARDLLIACNKELPGIWAAYEEVRTEKHQPDCTEHGGTDQAPTASRDARGRNRVAV